MDQIDALCAVLGEETRVLGNLANALRDEQRALVALRPEAIFAALVERRELGDELEGLAYGRRTLVRELGADPRASRASLATVLPGLSPDARTRLEGPLRTLRRALLEARGLERQNRRLAEASLRQTDDLLQTLRSLVPGARYGADARLAASPTLEQLDRRA